MQEISEETPRQMKTAIICPTSGLQRYATLSPLHLVLGQQWCRDASYREFYYERRAFGDTIILDNGAYETSQPLLEDDYTEVIRQLEPHVTVLPDFPFDVVRTCSASLRFLDTYADLFPCEWMFVPQARSGHIIDALKVVEVLVNDTRVGPFVKWIGLP